MDRTTDFVAWADAQAAALRRLHESRANDVTVLDLDGLAEEVQEMGDVHRDDLRRALARVIEHLLKLEHSPAADPRRGWRVSLVEHRIRAQDLLAESGTLRREVGELLPKAWSTGRKLAVRGMEIHGEDASAVPADLPWSPDQLLDDGFEPESRHGMG